MFHYFDDYFEKQIIEFLFLKQNPKNYQYNLTNIFLHFTHVFGIIHGGKIQILAS